MEDRLARYFHRPILRHVTVRADHRLGNPSQSPSPGTNVVKPRIKNSETVIRKKENISENSDKEKYK